MVPRELICLQSSWLSVSGAHFGECLCAYCVRSSRGHYSCLMAHFPTSACCSPVPLRCTLIPVTLSFFSLTVYHHMQGLPPPLHVPLGIMFAIASPPLTSLCPPFNYHLLSLSHLVCSHFIIWPACCQCIMWAIMMIMEMMTN